MDVALQVLVLLGCVGRMYSVVAMALLRARARVCVCVCVRCVRRVASNHLGDFQLGSDCVIVQCLQRSCKGK